MRYFCFAAEEEWEMLGLVWAGLRADTRQDIVSWELSQIYGILNGKYAPATTQ